MIDEAIILCGGQGTRLAGVLPAGMPKCYAGSVSFILHVICQLKDAEVKRAVLATGYGADHFSEIVTEWNGEGGELQLVESREDQPLGTGGAVRKALEHVKGERFFVLNGDSYVDYPLHQFVTWFELVKPDGAALLVQSPDYKSKTLGLMEEQNEWINGGVYLFERHLFDTLDGKRYSLETDFFPLWRSEGKKLMGFHTWSRFIDIGTPESLARAEGFFKDLQRCAS